MSGTSSSSGSSVESQGSSEDLILHHQDKNASLLLPSSTSKSKQVASDKTTELQRSLPFTNKVDIQAKQEQEKVEGLSRAPPQLRPLVDSDSSSHCSEPSNSCNNGEYYKYSTIGDVDKEHHVVKVMIHKEPKEGNKDVPADGIIYNPQPYDILLGRGKGVSETAGNIRFQRLVESHADRYIATARQSRGEYCGTIVKQAQHEWGARFLEPAPGGGWKLAELDKARKKVGQAVRYRLRQLPDAPVTKKPKNLPSPPESKSPSLQSKLSKKKELSLIKQNWNQSLAANYASSSEPPSALALLGSVAAASSGLSLASGPSRGTTSHRPVVPGDIVNKAAADDSAGLETDGDCSAEEGCHNISDMKSTTKTTREVPDKVTISRPAKATETELDRVFGGSWLPGMVAIRTTHPASSLPSPKQPIGKQECQTRHIIPFSVSSAVEDESNKSVLEQDDTLSSNTKRTLPCEETEAGPVHKKQRSTPSSSSDEATMEECIQILSSASLTLRCSAEDVNRALRCLRRQVVESAEDESIEDDAGWRFVCLHRGIPLVIQCMTVFATHAGVQSNACFLLSEILRLSDKKHPENGPEASYSFGLIMQAAGVIEAVLHAMREHVRDRLVNNNALAMLSTFTRELKRPQKELERTLVTQCVVPQVLMALQAFGADVKIARHTGNILWNLSMDSASRRVMVEAGTATIVSLAILQVPREFKAQFASLHLRLLQDYFYNGEEDDEDDDETRYSFQPAAIMSGHSPFQKR